jgi:hypothetical protein
MPETSTTLNFYCKCGCSIGLRSDTNAINETSRSVRDALWAAARVLGWRQRMNRFGVTVDGEECPTCWESGVEPSVATGPAPTRED